MSDCYQTIEDGPIVELKEKGSRFLGMTFHCKTESAAIMTLGKIKSKFHDATHHCSAWRVGRAERPTERFNDDGEPNGTAGRPILAAIQGETLMEALVIVVRYYGGVNLGCGGLSRAYGATAKMAVSKAPRRNVWNEATVSVTCSYDDVGNIEALLGQMAADVRKCERDFSTAPCFQITVLQSFAERLRRAIEDATGGRVTPT